MTSKTLASTTKHLNQKITDEQMYQTLFRAIHEHHLLPDTHLPEDELAKSFGVSRTRVRKILQRLIYEQLVTQTPNRGCFVASMTKKQIADIFMVRQALELGVIDLLALPLTDSQVEVLQQLCDAEAVALHEHSYGLANKLSGDFHIQLAAFSGNDTLVTLIRQLIARTSLAIAIYSNPATMKCDNGCHFSLLQQLQQTDKITLKANMAEHLQALQQHLLVEPLQKTTPDFVSLFQSLQS